MIFVKNSHFVWAPTRQRKLRKKLGRLVRSPKDTLDDMLEEHIKEVQTLLSEKKSEFQDSEDLSSRTDEGPQTMVTGLRSPPPPSGSHTPKRFEPGAGPSELLRSPRGPTLGYFSVSSPRSPRSPVKKTF
jgi:histone deacetylase 6